tara:strand:+ start:787 stop:1143 length:357 start_codon:yes stop_codon:yes gene_type:complete
MENLSYKIESYLGRKVNFHPEKGEIKLQNDSNGQGDYIAYWSDDVEKAKPTDEQLEALSSQAAASLAEVRVIKKRRKTYASFGDQLDLLYKDMIADKGDKTGEWFKAIKKVKDDNPKS